MQASSSPSSPTKGAENNMNSREELQINHLMHLNSQVYPTNTVNNLDNTVTT